MKRTIGWVILGVVALGGLVILALPGWMMYTGWGGGYGPMMSGGMMGGGMTPALASGASVHGFGGNAPGGMWLGMWLGWATQFILLALLAIGIGSVALLKIK